VVELTGERDEVANMDGLFVVGLGLIALVFGLLEVFPRLERLNPRIRKATGILRGREIGGYALMAFGAALIIIGLIAVAVELFS
jgi:hypothetical protein